MDFNILHISFCGAGLIAFDDNSQLIISKWVSQYTRSKLDISEREIRILEFSKRLPYIQFHRNSINEFQGI